MQEAILILENNEIFYGKSVGYIADSYGEIVFNTAMTGYQEVISDPSYKDQIITFTYQNLFNCNIKIILVQFIIEKMFNFLGYPTSLSINTLEESKKCQLKL